MSDIYLNFSRADEEIARKIYEDLEDAEFDVWTDEDYEPGTPTWTTAMRTAIKEAECMIVVLSPNAAKSMPVEEAVSVARLNHLAIFSVLVEGELKRATPIGLRVDDFLDLRENYDTEIANLIENIETLLEVYDDEDSDFWDEEDYYDAEDEEDELYEDEWDPEIEDDLVSEWDDDDDDKWDDEE
jgi:hypothetical protein